MKKGLSKKLTQGNHEWRVEKTQVCPVCVINYSPSIKRRRVSLSYSMLVWIKALVIFIHNFEINGQHLTKPGEAACPPDPYLEHTVTVVCMGGTLSGNSPGNRDEPLNKSVQTEHVSNLSTHH